MSSDKNNFVLVLSQGNCIAFDFVHFTCIMRRHKYPYRSYYSKSACKEHVVTVVVMKMCFF